MNRAPNTNGDTARTLRARGGYDAYFAPQGAAADTPRPDVAWTDTSSTDTPGKESSWTDAPATESPSTGATASSAESDGAQGRIPSYDLGDVAVEMSGQDSASGSGSASGSSAAVPDQPGRSRSSDPQTQYQSPTTAQTFAPSPSHGTAQPSATQRSVVEPASSPAQQEYTETTAYTDNTAYTGDTVHSGAPATGGHTTWSPPPMRPQWVPDRIAQDPNTAARVEVLPTTLSSYDLLAEIAAIKQAKLKSATGMRGALNKVGFNLGLSAAERRFEDRRARIRRQLTTPNQIAVLSVKGGGGRTTVTAALGSTFSSLRPDRVVAIDANPDFGDLASRTSRHPYGLTLRDLAQAPNLDAFSAVHSFTAINSSDLSVVASPWTTESVEALSGREYLGAVETLRRHYNLLLVDCGTGVLDSVTNTVLQTSDSIVVVTPATVGGVKGAVATLNWLASHGYQHLVAASIVAIVHHRPDRPIVEVADIEKLFATVSRPTCVVPYDAHLAEGGEIDLRLLDKETGVVFEELAAALADNFPGFLEGQAGDRGRSVPRGGQG
jgi:MinD-like ATPase involved in chromosome partitioning or flagellar assembly